MMWSSSIDMAGPSINSANLAIPRAGRSMREEIFAAPVAGIMRHDAVVKTRILLHRASHILRQQESRSHLVLRRGAHFRNERIARGIARFEAGAGIARRVAFGFRACEGKKAAVEPRRRPGKSGFGRAFVPAGMGAERR